MTRLLKPNGAALLALVVALLVVTWPMFGTFTIATITAGFVYGVAMRAWLWHHPSTIALSDRPLHSEINLASIPVRDDAGGLLFGLGGAAILLGLQPLRWFLLGSLLCAALFALVLIAWRQPASTNFGRGVRLLA